MVDGTTGTAETKVVCIRCRSTTR